MNLLDFCTDLGQAFIFMGGGSPLLIDVDGRPGIVIVQSRDDAERLLEHLPPGETISGPIDHEELALQLLRRSVQGRIRYFKLAGFSDEGEPLWEGGALTFEVADDFSDIEEAIQRQQDEGARPDNLTWGQLHAEILLLADHPLAPGREADAVVSEILSGLAERPELRDELVRRTIRDLVTSGQAAVAARDNSEG